MKHRVYLTRVCTKKLSSIFTRLFILSAEFAFLKTSKEVDVGFCALNTAEAVSPLIGKTNLSFCCFQALIL